VCAPHQPSALYGGPAHQSQFFTTAQSRAAAAQLSKWRGRQTQGWTVFGFEAPVVALRPISDDDA